MQARKTPRTRNQQDKSVTSNWNFNGETMNRNEGRTSTNQWKGRQKIEKNAPKSTISQTLQHVNRKFILFTVGFTPTGIRSHDPSSAFFKMRKAYEHSLSSLFLPRPKIRVSFRLGLQPHLSHCNLRLPEGEERSKYSCSFTHWFTRLPVWPIYRSPHYKGIW